MAKEMYNVILVMEVEIVQTAMVEVDGDAMLVGGLVTAEDVTDQVKFFVLTAVVLGDSGNQMENLSSVTNVEEVVIYLAQIVVLVCRKQ